MDKYEYKLKTGQMLELMKDGAFNKAAEIADSIDWKRVRNTKMLTDVSDIYEKNGDYQKSYEVLNIAYHRSEGSRKIVYRLCTLALKTKNVDEAIDYYDDFQQIAPKDPNKFILRYQILRAQRAPVEQQIEALEAFKKAEYIEEWAYELAKRYQEAGMTAECLEECDDLILWFNEGKYVYQAMELKMQYKPLTPSQQEKYDQRYARMSNETMEMPNVEEYKNEKDAAEAGEPIEELSAEAGEDSEAAGREPVPEPKKRETKGRKIGSTMKLDEALKSLLNLGMGEEDKAKDSSSEPVSTDVVFEEDKFRDAIEEIEAVADLDLIDEIANQKGLRELKVDPDLEELLPDPDDMLELDLEENPHLESATTVMQPIYTGEANGLELQGEKTLEELYADAGEPLEVPDLNDGRKETGVSGDTKILGTGLGGDTRILDKETVRMLAGLDSGAEGSSAAPVEQPEEETIEPAEMAGEVIPELDEEVREIIAELDEEARKTIEELEDEEPPSGNYYHAGAAKISAAESKDQIEGQMNLLDLMAMDMSEPAEEPEETKERGRTGSPILPLDIQRMIDEIEGVIPAEETDEGVESEADIRQASAARNAEPQENMGAMAEQLRVDESSEWFEDYDDVLDEEEYADTPAESDDVGGFEEEYTEDIEISFGREEETAEEYAAEAVFEDIVEDDGDREDFTIQYQEEHDYGYDDVVYTEEAQEYTAEEPEYDNIAYEQDEPENDGGELEFEEAVYGEPEYGEDAGEPEYAEGVGPVYGASRAVYEGGYEESEPVYEEAYEDSEPAYEEAYEDSEPAYEEAYEDSEPAYEEAYEESKPAYEEAHEDSELPYEEVYEETYEESEPVYGETYEESEPVYEETYENSEPVYEETYEESEPVYGETYEESEPVYGETYEESELVYGETYENSEPVYEEAYEESEPVYEGGYEDGESVYEGGYEENESIYEDEYGESESVYEGSGYEESESVYEGGGYEDGESVYEDGYEDAESVYEGEYEYGEAAYEDGYEDREYAETDYEDETEYAGEYDGEEEYEDDREYEDEEYYAEEEYDEDKDYDAAYIEKSLKREFRPQRRSRKGYDEREVPEEDDDEMDILSATTPLSRKETAKMIATGKTSPLPMDEISDALSMSDTGFVVHGRYDLRTQSGIGTRAGLTEEQKKLFSYFVPVRGMSEQLVDVLEQDKNCTNRRGTSITGNLLIIGNKGNGKTVLAVDVVKAIQKQRNIRQGRVAIVTGDSLNKKKISDIFGKLYGGALIIEKAGKMNEKTVARVNKAMERDTGELLIVLEDQRKPLDRLLTSNREFRRKFTSRLEVPILINDELVTFGQTYAQENGYQIDEMGILALYSRIDMLQREDHAVTIAEVKEVMDEAMEHSQKTSAKKLVKRVLGKNRDDSDRIILTEKDFI